MCGDIRWVRADVSVGHPAFGTLVRCPACGDLAERQRRREVYRRKQGRIRQYTQMVGRARRQTFETFDPNSGNHDVQLALQMALQFAEEPRDWLVLSGTKGTGKTHLASAIYNRIEQCGDPEEQRPLAMYLTTPDLLQLLRSGYERDDYGELLELCRTVDILILDDLGAESQRSEWVHEQLYSILNYRYQAELPTVVVTNDELDALPPRLHSRLADDGLCTHVSISAPDYRQRRSHPGRVVW